MFTYTRTCTRAHAHTLSPAQVVRPSIHLHSSPLLHVHRHHCQNQKSGQSPHHALTSSHITPSHVTPSPWHPPPLRPHTNSLLCSGKVSHCIKVRESIKMTAEHNVCYFNFTIKHITSMYTFELTCGQNYASCHSSQKKLNLANISQLYGTQSLTMFITPPPPPRLRCGRVPMLITPPPQAKVWEGAYAHYPPPPPPPPRLRCGRVPMTLTWSRKSCSSKRR